MGKIKGGGNLTVLCSIASGFAAPSGKVIDLNANFTTAAAGHEKTNDLVLTVTHEIFDPTFTGLFDTYLQSTTSTTTEKYENNVDASTSGLSTSDYAKYLIGLTLSGYDSTNGCFVRAGVYELQGGGYTMEADKTIRAETKLVGVKTPATITIPATYFTTGTTAGTVKLAAAVVIPSGYMAKSQWM
jgi:hypothetical protein